MEPRFMAGDLAVGINDHHPSNLGCIVKVVEQHDGKGDLVFHDVGVVWLVECAHPMTWTAYGKRIRRKRGPVPDSYLRPIHGKSIGSNTVASGEWPYSKNLRKTNGTYMCSSFDLT